MVLNGGSFSNEDDLTIKLTEIIFTNALIKTGLSKGVATQALMVIQNKLYSTDVYADLAILGTMGILAAISGNVH